VELTGRNEAMRKNEYVKIPNSVLYWEFAQDKNALHLYLYLILKAQQDDRRWGKYVIHEGQVLMDFPQIEQEVGLDADTFTTALKELVNTGYITLHYIDGHDLITLNSWKRHKPEYLYYPIISGNGCIDKQDS
jgi:hypothetical protein